jgi:hypothetical protein
VEGAAASPAPPAQAAAHAHPSPDVTAPDVTAPDVTAPDVTATMSPAIPPVAPSAQSPQATTSPTAAPSDGDRPPPDQAAKDAKKTVNKVDAEFFTVEVVQCKASGTAIGCDLKITNNGDDRNLAIDTGQLYDNFGNRYEISARRVANVSGWNRIKLFRHTPVKAWVEFNKDSQQASESITAMELKFAADPRGFEVQFRNLPLASGGAK